MAGVLLAWDFSENWAMADNQMQVWLALDDSRRAMRLARQVHGKTHRLKIGASIIAHPMGRSIVSRLRDRLSLIMLDTNIHMTPEVAKMAAFNYSRYWRPSYITASAAAGIPMLRAVVEGARMAETGVMVIANTLILSMDTETMKASWEEADVGPLVQARAIMANEAKCHGVIVAPPEVARVVAAVGHGMRVFATGIRKPKVPIPGDDLRRTGTAEQARKGGATGLIIGRGATAAKDPLQALEELLNPNQGSDEELIPPRT